MSVLKKPALPRTISIDKKKISSGPRVLRCSLAQATFIMSSVFVNDLSRSQHQSVAVLDYEYSPFFLRDRRASETRARVKITPREIVETGLLELVVYNCSGGPASLCFLGSSWVLWGQKMCVLKSLMSQVLSNTSVKLVFGTHFPSTPSPMY